MILFSFSLLIEALDNRNFAIKIGGLLAQIEFGTPIRVLRCLALGDLSTNFPFAIKLAAKARGSPLGSGQFEEK